MSELSVAGAKPLLYHLDPGLLCPKHEAALNSHQHPRKKAPVARSLQGVRCHQCPIAGDKPVLGQQGL